MHIKNRIFAYCIVVVVVVVDVFCCKIDLQRKTKYIFGNQYTQWTIQT